MLYIDGCPESVFKFQTLFEIPLSEICATVHSYCQFNVNGFGGNILPAEMIYCHEVVFTINEVVAYAGIR